MAVDTVRETALKILRDINQKGAYSNIALGKYLDSGSLKDIDRGFITELVYGTVKWRLTIDWIIGSFSSVKSERISPWIMDILRLGIFQLLYTDRIPVSAACNESVELAKKYGHRAAAGYVNGLLRAVSRQKDGLPFPDIKNDPVKHLSIKYSFPEWIVREWLDLFGEQFSKDLMESSNGRPDFSVRVNTLRLSRDELLKKLTEEGVEAEPGKYLAESVILRNPSAITKLSAFKQGLFQVQDESSMLVARVLDPKPGDMVIDVCSAPGGKATHIAELMKNNGKVVARDIHTHKLKLIEEASKRLGLDIITTELFDAADFDEAARGKADRVLVDAPCTGLGIIRRKPDIKWSKSGSDREEIAALQKKILQAAAGYVKPGGVLVYSTCTLGPFENENVIGEFLGNNNDFLPEDITGKLPPTLRSDEARNGYIHLFPNREGVDGFFISRIRRR